MELLPEIEFSESEFEQAGLLPDLDSCSAALRLGHNVATSVNPQQHFNNMQSPSASSFGPARRLQNPSEPWQIQTSSAGLQERAATQHATLGTGVPALRPQNIAQRWTNLRQSTTAQQEQPIEASAQHRSLPLDVTADMKKQANRDHQKRFRERQKVLSHDHFHYAPACNFNGHIMLPA